ncbi:MAG: ABC transporter permease [Actinobacteria bacterium]|nr:ABC transporter permease [Actinomycetota bacterium]
MSRWFSRNLIRIYTGAALLFILLPIFYTIAFSFNDTEKRNISWQGFTIRAWLNPCEPIGICEALGNSFKVGITATVVATILGTMIAFALGRYDFKGRGTTNLLIFLPMATPEVVLGASLLSMFINVGLGTGLIPVIISHIMFCISFVVVTVKARIASLDPKLEEAARDLYANEWETFRRITLPLVAPGIAAAALLAFALSFDDFIITNFNSGTVDTFPEYVWTAALRGVPPQANVIGTMMFIIALVLVFAGQIFTKKREAKK